MCLGAVAMLNRTVVVALLAFIPACGNTPTPQAQPDAPHDDTPAVHEFKFNEPVEAGDLRIRITRAGSQICGGQYHGSFANRRLLAIGIVIDNVSKGKIADWPGWQGKVVVTDEHGNNFAPASLRGWSWMPNNEPDENLDGDDGAKINPGARYVNYLYYENAPPTSKEATISVKLNGYRLRFRGRLVQVVQ